MRIVQIHWGSQYLLGGVERTCQRIAEMAVQAGHDILTVGIETASLSPYKVALAGKFIGIPFPNFNHHPNKRKLEQYFSCLASIFALYGEVVFSWGSQSFPACYFKPSVVRLANPFSWTPELSRTNWLRHATRILIQTEAGRKFISNHSPEAKKRVRVIPQGIIIPQNVRALNRPARHVLCVAPFESKKKDIPFLIQSFRNVVDRFPDATLTLAGRGNVDACMRAVNEHYLQKHVHFLRQEHASNWDRDLDTAYRKADIFAMHTLKETFGIVYLEAMAYGLPIVTVQDYSTPQGQVIQEVVGDNGVGVISNLFDLNGFSSNIIHLMKDFDMARRFSAAGINRARSQYDWRRLINGYLDVFGEASAQKNNSR
jgi:glycosyltransferase involved in cell wall biosynthesis